MTKPHSQSLPAKLNVLLIGSGGREHALALKIKQSPRLASLWTTHPENPGLAAIAKAVDVPVSIREIYRLQQFIEREKIHLIVIGPEDPLAEGYVDKLASPTTLVFGPTQAGAQLEADKAWAKQLMRGASIPTGDARVFTNSEAARSYVESREREDEVLGAMLLEADRFRDPADRRRWINQQRESVRELAKVYAAKRSDLPVIKASGLAKGKGVFLPESLSEAIDVIEQIMVRKVFGEAGAKIVIEEKLAGPEASVLAITDGETILVLPPAQDHKRLGNGDTGPNTGGMGAVCPATTITPELMDTIEREVLVSTVDALNREGIPYKGVIFAGLMLTRGGPRVLEFNCRFGDPECQSIVTRLKSDLLELIIATCTGSLADCNVEWDSRPSCCVVLANAGYPEKVKPGAIIHGIDDAAAMKDVFVFHAGTKREGNNIIATGGRVLNVVALGNDAADAKARAYDAVSKISFAGMQYRTDIGGK
ncbi:MAG: phosphoribosylamine--glycine ligase [Phycisphaerales bacterium]